MNEFYGRDINGIVRILTSKQDTRDLNCRNLYSAFA